MRLNMKLGPRKDSQGLWSRDQGYIEGYRAIRLTRSTVTEWLKPEGVSWVGDEQGTSALKLTVYLGKCVWSETSPWLQTYSQVFLQWCGCRALEVDDLLTPVHPNLQTRTASGSE